MRLSSRTIFGELKYMSKVVKVVMPDVPTPCCNGAESVGTYFQGCFDLQRVKP